MPPVTRKIPTSTVRTSNAKSRAGDAAAASQARQRGKRDALMAQRATPAAKATMAKADATGKARTFTNNVAAQGVVKKAEGVRKAALFKGMYAAGKKAKADGMARAVKASTDPASVVRANTKQLRRAAGLGARAARRAK